MAFGSKLKTGLLFLVILVLLAVLVRQEQQVRRWSTEAAGLRAELAAATSSSGSPAAGAELARGQEQGRELLRLRSQVTALRAQLAQATNAAMRAVQASRSADAAAKAALDQEQQFILTRASFTKGMMYAFRRYATENDGRFPPGFDEAAGYLMDETKILTNVSADEFEIVYHGALNEVTNRDEGDIIVIRERGLHRTHDGRVGRVYGMADGSCLQEYLEDQSAVENWERAHTR